jgi:hypothetical protein
VLQVPRGRYSVIGVVSNGDVDNRIDALLGDPGVEIDGDSTVALDATAAEPFHPSVQGVATDRSHYAETGVLSTPARGTGGQGQLVVVESYYPMAANRLAPMSGDPAVFEAQHVFRLQAPPLVVAVGGGDPLAEIVPAGPAEVPPGTTTLTAVDAGAGADMSGTAGKLAVVRLPNIGDRTAVTERADAAGAAMVAFVDESRSRVQPFQLFDWADIPVVAAGGASATSLVAAGRSGATVTVTSAASPFAYDIARRGISEIDPTPVVRGAERRRLARIDERFHHDADGTGATYDSRGPVWSSAFGYLASAGPLPERRTSYVTPEVVWQSQAEGTYLGELFVGFPPLDLVGRLSMDRGATYAPGSRQRLGWLRRPQWPGLVAEFFEDTFCPAGPAIRTSDTLFIHVVPFQDGPDRLTCGDALDETLTVRQDGRVVGREAYNSGTFPVTPGDADFVVDYEQSGRAPYEHHSTTRWSFRSGEPSEGEDLLPMLTVGYGVPLDIENRPTGDTATFTVRNVADPSARIRPLKVWTSTDHGATWRRAAVTRSTARRFTATLPEVAAGTAVSLRIDASDRAGNRIEQTLVDAYTG